MSGLQAPVHWVGDAPTSLHGNAATSLERTTRDPLFVTCLLCRSILAREHLGGVFLYGMGQDFIARCSCGWEEEWKKGHEADDALAAHLSTEPPHPQSHRGEVGDGLPTTFDPAPLGSEPDWMHDDRKPWGLANKPDRFGRWS